MLTQEKSNYQNPQKYSLAPIQKKSTTKMLRNISPRKRIWYWSRKNPTTRILRNMSWHWHRKNPLPKSSEIFIVEKKWYWSRKNPTTKILRNILLIQEKSTTKIVRNISPWKIIWYWSRKNLTTRILRNIYWHWPRKNPLPEPSEIFLLEKWEKIHYQNPQKYFS